MPFDLAYQIEGDYLRVEVTGLRNYLTQLEDSLSVWRAVVRKCKETNTCKVLAIWNVPGPLSIPTIFNVWGRPDQFGWNKATKIAAVYPDRRGYRDSKFAETVCRNRGIKGLAFDNEDAAREWLLQTLE